MRMLTLMRLQCVWSAARVGMLERGTRCALRVLKADTTVTQMPQLPAFIALLGTTLHQGLPAVTSVQRVSMTLTPILQLHARIAQPVSTQQQGLRPALTVQLAMRTTTMIRSLCVQSAVRVGMLERGARRALCVLVADTTVTLSHRLRACFALPNLTLHQDLPAVTSVQRVGMTLTPILQLCAWDAPLVSTQ